MFHCNFIGLFYYIKLSNLKFFIMWYLGKTEKNFVLTIEDMKRLDMDKKSIFPILKESGYNKCPKTYEAYEVVFDSRMVMPETKDDILIIPIVVDRRGKLLFFKNILFYLDQNFSNLIVECNQYITEFEVHYINGFIRFIFRCEKSKVPLMEDYSKKRPNLFAFIKNCN
jgi:hypothetical protein